MSNVGGIDGVSIIDRGMVGEADDGGIAGGVEKGLKAGETEGERNPDRSGAVGVVFDEEEGVLWAEIESSQNANQG